MKNEECKIPANGSPLLDVRIHIVAGGNEAK
jgi:hypothetical protein